MINDNGIFDELFNNNNDDNDGDGDSNNNNNNNGKSWINQWIKQADLAVLDATNYNNLMDRFNNFLFHMLWCFFEHS